MALRAGGFAVSFKSVPVLFDEVLDRATLANMVAIAAVSEEARDRARSALYAPEPLELSE
jgi:hypothetical protein